MYYSVGREDKAHHIRVAVSETPEGSYRDTGHLITDPFTCPFAIDASPFQDRDGTWYLFYARDFLDGDRPGTGIVVDRLLDMTQLAGEERVVVRAKFDWQIFLRNRVMYGARYDWHTIEGPCVVERGGRYWCLFSAGRWENESYGVDWAVADSIIGPWMYEGSPDGARLLRTIPGQVLGPGHNSLAEGRNGDSDYIVYHAWDASMTARRMFIDPLPVERGGSALYRAHLATPGASVKARGTGLPACENGNWLTVAVRIQVPKKAALVRFVLHPWGRAFLIIFLFFNTAALLTFTFYYPRYAKLIEQKLLAGPLTNTSMLFAAPQPVMVGDEITIQEIASALRRSGYAGFAGDQPQMGWYNMRADGIEIFPGPDSYFDEEEAVIKFKGNKVSRSSRCATTPNEPNT